MASQPSQQAMSEQGQRTSVGTVCVVDSHPLNQLFNYLEHDGGTVRTDERGHIVDAVMEDSHWVDDTTFELAETEVDEGHWSRQNKAWDRHQRQTAKSRIMETITLEETRRVISAAEQKAEKINCPMDIAVVGAGDNLKAHVRMDGAFIGRITISINKAYITIAFQGGTKDEGPGGHDVARAAALRPERRARGKHRHLPRRYPLIARRRDRRRHRCKHRHR